MKQTQSPRVLVTGVIALAIFSVAGIYSMIGTLAADVSASSPQGTVVFDDRDGRDVFTTTNHWRDDGGLAPNVLGGESYTIVNWPSIVSAGSTATATWTGTVPAGTYRVEVSYPAQNAATLHDGISMSGVTNASYIVSDGDTILLSKQLDQSKEAGQLWHQLGNDVITVKGGNVTVMVSTPTDGSIDPAKFYSVLFADAVRFVPVNDLSLTLTSDTSTGDTSQGINVSYSVKNLSKNPATNVTVTFKIPSWMQLKTSDNCTASNGTVLCKLGMLSISGSYEGGIILNTVSDCTANDASISGTVSEDQYDSDTSNNTYTTAPFTPSCVQPASSSSSSACIPAMCPFVIPAEGCALTYDPTGCTCAVMSCTSSSAMSSTPASLPSIDTNDHEEHHSSTASVDLHDQEEHHSVVTSSDAAVSSASQEKVCPIPDPPGNPADGCNWDCGVMRDGCRTCEQVCSKPAEPANADLNVMIAAAPTVQKDGTLIYNVLVGNNGPAAASNVTIWDYYSLGAGSFVSANSIAGVSCEAHDTAMVCNLGPVSAGGTVAVNLVFSAKGASCTDTLNDHISVTSDQTDQDLSNNIMKDVHTSISCDAASSSVAAWSPGTPDLKILEQGKQLDNGQMLYNITFANNGGAAAADTKVLSFYSIDPSKTFIQATQLPAGVSCKPVSTNDTHAVECDFGSIPPLTQVSYSLTFSTAGVCSNSVGAYSVISTSTQEKDTDGETVPFFQTLLKACK